MSTIVSQATTTEAVAKMAVLETIDLARLYAGEPNEKSKLLRAATSPGMFYLDFRNYSGGVLESLPTIYRLTDQYFDQPKEGKMKDFRKDQPNSLDRGYKWSANDETFEMADDELLRGALALPPILSNHAPIFKHFSARCHAAATVLLHCLSDTLHLSGAARFEHRHRAGTPSNSGLKLIAEPSLARAADVPENKHTDGGTLTLLFYQEIGLHVRLPDTGEWAFAHPPPEGCALVNVADALQRLSGGRLHSPLHRVTQPEDGAGKRYFLSYFLRPECTDA